MMFEVTYQQFIKLNLPPLLVLLVVGHGCVLPVFARVLEGNVNEQDFIHPGNQGAPSLNRNEINRQGDPFGGGGGGADANQQFDPSPGLFQIPTTQPLVKKGPLNGNAQDSGGAPSFQMMQGTPAAAQQFGPRQSTVEQSGNARDPDNSREMQLAWDQWHKNVAQAIYQRFMPLSNKFFEHGEPLAAIVYYSVTRDGQVTNAHLTQKSQNVIYNTLVLTVVNSLSGNNVLAFPPGSRRMSVDKSGTFMVNYGGPEGFKFTTGDRETVPQQ